jgi:hypothetical protein
MNVAVLPTTFEVFSVWGSPSVLLSGPFRNLNGSRNFEIDFSWNSANSDRRSAGLSPDRGDLGSKLDVSSRDGALSKNLISEANNDGCYVANHWM